MQRCHVGRWRWAGRYQRNPEGSLVPTRSIDYTFSVTVVGLQHIAMLPLLLLRLLLLLQLLLLSSLLLLFLFLLLLPLLFSSNTTTKKHCPKAAASMSAWITSRAQKIPADMGASETNPFSLGFRAPLK